MHASKKKELIIGLAMLGAGIAYLVMTLRLPGHSGIDAASIPFMLAVMLCGLGVIHLLMLFRSAKALEAETTEESVPEGVKSDVKTVFLTLGLITAYIASLSYAGFPIATPIYLYLQFLVLTPEGQKPNHVGYAATALITAGTVYFLFREVFDLMLPSGPVPF